MTKDRDDPLGEDPVAWARAETTADNQRKLKRYGLLTLGNIFALALMLKGMPGHLFWSALGMPLAISFACFFTPTLYYGALLIGERLDRKTHR